MEIISSVEFQITMSSINKKREANKDAFRMLDKAESSDEIKDAGAAISDAWRR